MPPVPAPVDLERLVAVHTPDSLESALDSMEWSLADGFRPVEQLARDAERVAGELGREDLVMRARLVTADVLRRQGEAATGARIAKAVNVWAEQHENDYLRARSHRHLSIFFLRLGDAAEALTHAVECMKYTPEGIQPRLKANHIALFALALDVAGSHAEAMRRFHEALEIASADGDATNCMITLNNMAYSACEQNEGATAMELVERMRTIERRHGVTLNALFLDTIARAYIVVGRYSEVKETLRPVFEDETGALLTEEDALAEALLTAAEAERLDGDFETAQGSLDRARALCDERGLAAVGVKVRLEQASLHAATGDFRAAYEEHRRYHADAEALQSAQRDARADALRTVYETEEARRDSERFREMALHDSLTGLHNRRYVDDHLAVLTGRAAEQGTPLSVALMDLDYFKRVNDTFSHEIGDRVLRRIAELLGGAVTPGGLVARMGGEEFLLIMPGIDAPAALRHCERVRHAVRGHGWRDLVGDLPITASIGVTTVTGTRTTVSALLSDADRNLYAAKRSGRDRVVGDAARPI